MRPMFALTWTRVSILLVFCVLAGGGSAAADDRPRVVPNTSAQANESFWAPSAVPARLDEYWLRMRALAGGPLFESVPVLAPHLRDDPLFASNNALSPEDPSAAAMRGMGASIDRLELRWDEVEPRPGEYHFGRLDRLFDSAARWDTRVLAVVVGAPAWAVGRADHVGAGPPLGLRASSGADAGNGANGPWPRFLRMIARRYGERVAAWEIWNEPNIPEFWRGTVDDYALMLRSAHSVLKNATPRATIVLGGLVQDDGAYLATLLARLCEQPVCDLPFDAVGWHVYNNPADVARVAEHTRALLGLYGLSRPVWITEANVPVNDPRGPTDAVIGPDAVTLAEQAAFVLRLYAVSRASGVSVSAVYRASDVHGHYWGLMRQNGTARPAMYAYRTAARWLSHTRPLEVRAPVPGTTQVRLERSGETLDVLWSDAPTPTTVRLPWDGENALLVSVEGAMTPRRAVNGYLEIELPPARPAGIHTVPLGAPVIVVAPHPVAGSQTARPRPA